jgi:hypothetical protein
MLAAGTPDSTIGESRMLKSGTLKLAVAAFTIASAIGLTGIGAQAVAATAVPATQAAMSAAGPHLYTAATSATVVLPAVGVDFMCPDRTVCLFQNPGHTGGGARVPHAGLGRHMVPH